MRVGHTRNPALRIVIDPGHELLARQHKSLTDVAPAIIDLLALQTMCRARNRRVMISVSCE